jgi:hypothetical protein
MMFLYLGFAFKPFALFAAFVKCPSSDRVFLPIVLKNKMTG